MIAVLGNVFEREGSFAFIATLDEKSKGYEFDSKKGATMARARLVKALKKDNIKVYYGKESKPEGY